MFVLSYRMEHVMGEPNYWTDLMTRWGVGWIVGSEHKAHGKMASLFAQPYSIPERAIELQLRLCVEAHCGSAEHRAYEETLGTIREYVAWTTMAKDAKVFVQNCLHCVETIPGGKVPCPLGMQLHTTKPNEILHFDFLYIELSRNRKYQYVLLLKDDFSGYSWLVPCRTADVAATVDALMRWFSVFGRAVMDIGQRQPIQEQGGTTSTKGIQKHRFTIANCLWSNGTIESACKQVIRAFRAVLSELKMYAVEASRLWTALQKGTGL
jgi:hypothetical protein